MRLDGKAKADGEAWADRYFQEQEKIAVLSFEEAQRQAEFLLADPLKFECTVSVAHPNEAPIKLAPGLQSLFSRYETIRVVDDEAYLSRQEIAPYDWDGNGLSWGQDFWQIGAAHGHGVALVKPNEEAVYDTADDELGERHPSIYHWLLWVSAIASDFT